MKKIFFLMTLIMGLVFGASAQNVEASRPFNNTYISIDGGIVSPMVQPGFTEFFTTSMQTFGFEFGKNITPIIGLSVAEQGTFDLMNKAVLRTNTIGALKINLMNWFGGYKGYPRLFEVVLVPGIGWMHDFVDEDDPNYITYNTGCEMNFNLGKNRAWQLGLRPSVVWNNHEGTGMGFYKDKADIRVVCGLTYKFGYWNQKGEKTNNFTIVEDGVPFEDYVDLMARYDSLSCVQNYDTVFVEKIVTVAGEQTVVAPMDLVIYFDKGCYEISAMKKSQIEQFANVAKNFQKVKVIGSADSGTGSYETNHEIAHNRAEGVTKILTENGVDNVEIEVVFDVDQDPSTSRCAIIGVVE